MFWNGFVSQISKHGVKKVVCLSKNGRKREGVAIHLNWIGGWMTCDFTSSSTLYQSHQDSGQMIMKGSVHRNPVFG